MTLSYPKPCSFFCRVVPCWLSGIPKVVVFATLATLSMLGTYCLTTYGGRDAQCKLDLECHRRPDIDLPLTWLSTATCEKEPFLKIMFVRSYISALTGVLVSYILHLYRNITRTWPCTENTRPRRLTTTVRTHPAKAPKSSNGNDHKGNWEEVLPRRPLPPRESSPTLLSSYVLRSVPLQKREMNKLGLTVITGIPMDSPFEFYQLEIPPKKRWRGRGRDAWERKPLETSE